MVMHTYWDTQTHTHTHTTAQYYVLRWLHTSWEEINCETHRHTHHSTNKNNSHNDTDLLPVSSNFRQVQALAQIHQVQHVFLKTASTKTCTNAQQKQQSDTSTNHNCSYRKWLQKYPNTVQTRPQVWLLKYDGYQLCDIGQKSLNRKEILALISSQSKKWRYTENRKL